MNKFVWWHIPFPSGQNLSATHTDFRYSNKSNVKHSSFNHINNDQAKKKTSRKGNLLFALLYEKQQFTLMKADAHVSKKLQFTYYEKVLENTESFSERVRKRYTLAKLENKPKFCLKAGCWNTGWKFWLKARRSSAVAGPHASHAKMTCASRRVAAVADLLSNFVLFDERQVAGLDRQPTEAEVARERWKNLTVHFQDGY